MMGLGGLCGLGDSTSGTDRVTGPGGGVIVRGFGLTFGLAGRTLTPEGFSSVAGSSASAMLSLDTAGVRMGDLLGDWRLMGSPALACSNMEMSDPVGAIDPESTTSPRPDEAIFPGVLAFGVGLEFLLAASVAAMKLALLASTEWCGGLAESCSAALSLFGGGGAGFFL